MADKVIMLGNEAIARGAYEAGVKVSSAYPGTPSTEISEYLVQYRDDVYEEWAPNEKVATEVAVGASLSGVRAMACMKHVGLNVAADPLYSVSYMGVNGGLVIVVAWRRIRCIPYPTWASTAALYSSLPMIRDFTAPRTSRIQEWWRERRRFR